ncbi:phage terminase large subunit [uncultured Paraglaciecola sp.]|uniref:phage terminase large subunit n=1 Tax=uncultured Paraglaciecola sp. TaxID=1765024 RepID=UPI002636C6BE|nr:phage terminase large subunit [uncultured Paraglaciecola sp.]
MTKAQIQLPPKLVPAYTQHYDYIGKHGGRGGAKSYTAHLMAAVEGYARPIRMLFCREFQNSLKESSFAQLVECIESIPWLADSYTIGRDYIRGKNGTECIFSGLARNTGSTKGLTDIDYVVVEEAEDLSQDSIDILDKTIRKDGSTIVFVWNPELRNSPIDKFMRQHPPERSIVIEINHADNPFKSELMERKRLRDKKADPVNYPWIWEGKYRESSETNPFLSYTIEAKEFRNGDVYDPSLMHRVISIDPSACVGADEFVMCEQGRDYGGDTHLIDMYSTNDADLPTRLAKVEEFIRRRRPDFLVIERNTDSIPFIETLDFYLKANDIYIKITDPTAASRGKKETYITNWLQPLFNSNSYYCKLSDKLDIIHTEMYSFSVDRTDNKDDKLDSMTSGVRYLITPDRPEKEYKVSNMNLPSAVQTKLERALSGKRQSTGKSFL